MAHRIDDLWVLVWKDPDISKDDGHCWVAHALQYDVVSQGRTLSHAVSCVREAAALFMMDRMAAGRDPLDYGAAPEDWDRLHHIMEKGRRVEVGALSDEQKAKMTFAVAIRVMAVIASDEPMEAQEPVVEEPWACPSAAA